MDFVYDYLQFPREDCGYISNYVNLNKKRVWLKVITGRAMGTCLWTNFVDYFVKCKIFQVFVFLNHLNKAIFPQNRRTEFYEIENVFKELN